MLEIDGSYGEGGGQILRTALAFSCLTNKPCRIVNIRRGRRKSGLMPQHLAAVRAAASISGAAVQGDEPGSTRIIFIPEGVRGGEFEFHIGTAGSVTLLLQTLIPPLLLADRPSRVTLTGGTHVPFSPSFHYLAGVFVPVLRRLGGEVRLTINSYGFYPRGGGSVCAEILPTRGMRPLTLASPGMVRRIIGCSAVGNLPLGIAERQRAAARATLAEWSGDSWPSAHIELLHVPGPGQGTFVFIQAETDTVPAGFTSLGARGKRAETVGSEAAQELCVHLSTGAALDPHLADQIVPFLALCPEESSFTTSRITRHLLTNLWVINLFRPLHFQVTGEEGQPGEVIVR
ncbi:MAG TPA: RNA 3'-terminal phosphate cyclase [Geobacteraceae bacterium]